MSDPPDPREDFNDALTQIATYLTVAGSLALMMSFAYESAKSYSLDPKADVIGSFTLDDLMLSLRHWLPEHFAYWLLGGGAAFLAARRKLSGLPLLATVLGSIIAADLTSRLLPQQFAGPLTWLDYVLLPSGLMAALFLLTAKRAAWFNATKLIAATAVGLICTAAEAGIQDAPLISLMVLVQTIDPDVRACPTERLAQGGRLIFGDIRRDGHGRYWYEPPGGKTPDCKRL